MAIKVTGRSSSSYTQDAKLWGALPSQKVSSKKKESKEWRNANVQAIVSMAQAGGGGTRSSRYNKQINYDLINSRFKSEDFKHVLNPYGVEDSKFVGSATKMQNYNIIRQAFETLKGEEMKMGMEFRAVAVNGDATLEKNNELTMAITEAIKARIAAVATDDIDPETGKLNAPDIEEVANAYRTEYSHPIEIASNQLLKFLTKKDKLQMKFSQGWEHALVSAEEIYYAGIVDGHPSLRVCNPLNVAFDREGDNPFIHKGEWAMEERWMPRGSVIDLYGDTLGEDLVDKLDRGELGGNMTSSGMHRDFAYRFDGGTSINGGSSQDFSHVYVAHCAWRSWVKLGKLDFLDPRTGMVESVIVDDSFTMNDELKEMDANVTWYWETQIWEGTQIGGDTFVNVGPLENQTKDLPYVGYVYNNVNSVATSLVDMVKAHQYTYIIVWYRLEQELAKAKGKKFLMDIAQLPKSKGWTVDQWMYYFDNMGVAWVNSLEEGRQGDPNSTSKFNQFTSIDMTLSQSVGQYMQILQKLEDQVEKITGVSPQRAGDIGRSETATGAQRAIIQSTNNTKPLFFYHDMIREESLNQLIELCKVAYADGKRLEYAVDEKTVDTINISKGLLNGTDFGVFMSNSFEDAENLQKLENYLAVALQYDKTNLSDIVSVLTTKSVSKVRDVLVAGERDKQQRDAGAQEQANKSQMEAQEIAKQIAEENREAEREREKLRSDTDIEVALIRAESSIKDDDSDIKAKVAERRAEIDNRKASDAKELKIKDQEIQKAQLEETIRSNKAREASNKSKYTQTKTS